MQDGVGAAERGEQAAADRGVEVDDVEALREAQRPRPRRDRPGALALPEPADVEMDPREAGVGERPVAGGRDRRFPAVVAQPPEGVEEAQFGLARDVDGVDGEQVHPPGSVVSGAVWHRRPRWRPGARRCGGRCPRTRGRSGSPRAARSCSRTCSAGERVLDLGAGDGAFAAELARGRLRAWSRSTSPRRRCGARRARVPGLDARRVDEGAPLPLDEDAVDVVWAGEVLEHVADVVGLLADVRRVLRWGGRLLVTTPFHGRVVGRAARAARRRSRRTSTLAPITCASSPPARCARCSRTRASPRSTSAPAGGPPLLRRALHAVAR